MLLVSLAILALLTVFALTLTSVCNLERQASANYVQQVEARLAAEAGCAAAIAQAQGAVDSNWYSSGEWYVSGVRRPALVGAWTPTSGYFVKINGFGGRNYYSTQSFDCGSRLSVNLNTPNIQNALTVVGLTNAAAVVTEAQDRGGFRSRKELREFIVADAGQALWNTVRDRITVHEVRSPVADLTGSSGNLPLNYSGGARGSAMVNINGADVRVIAAVLGNLSGSGITFDTNGTKPSGEWLSGGKAGGRSRALASGVSASLPPNPAALAAAIVAARPFLSWQAFDDFLKGAAGVSDDQRCLIMTICGANAQIMGYNPDRDYRRENYKRLFDKGGLIEYTTEFCLGPSGVFEVRAHGWVTDGSNKVLAEEWVSKVVRCFVPVHYGSQVELDAMAQAPSDVQSMPEPLNPDPVAGHYRLTTEAGSVSGSPSSAFRIPSQGGSFTLNGAEGKPLRNQGYYSPDGVIVWREGWAGTVGGAGPITLSASGLATDLSQDGGLSFWIKLADDSSAGTDEVLLSVTIDDSSVYPRVDIRNALNTYADPPNIGCTIKVERFKNQIRATWYYWGAPTDPVLRGAVSRFVNGLMHVSQNVDWKAGEWHHVRVWWTNTLQDWTQAALGNPIESADVNDSISVSCTGNSGGSYDFFAYGACRPGPEWFTLEGVLKQNTTYNLGKSGSIPLDLNTVYAGGFTHSVSNDPIYTTSLTGGGSHYRFTNGTIDDVGIEDSEPATLFRPQRFSTSGSVRFNLPVPGGYTAGAVAVHGVVPRSGGSPIAGNAGSLSSNGTAANGGAFPGGGTGTNWTVTLAGDGTRTPTVEGFTIYLKHKTELLEEADFPLTGE